MINLHNIYSLLQQVTIMEQSMGTTLFNSAINDSYEIYKQKFSDQVNEEIIAKYSIKKNLLRTLSNNVFSKILKFLDHKDLICLAIAYPTFIEEVCRGCYWKNITAHFDTRLFSRENFKALVDHLGENLEQMCFNGNLCNGQEKILNILTNIKEIRIFEIYSETVLNNICESMLQLEDITLEYYNLNDD